MYKNHYKYDDMKRSEHMAVRTTVGWYLWTHKLVEVTGEDATQFMDYTFANPIGNLKYGKERYTTMLGNDGNIVDDVVVFRFEENKYWISTLFSHTMIPVYEAQKGDMKVFFKDITLDNHMYAVQGPKAKEMVNSIVKNPVDELKFFSFEENEIDGIKVIINRAGFTGEKCGYEIYIDAADADNMEEILRAAAEKLDGKEITEFQIMAWTLPTEAGFYYMRDLSFKNPFEVGLEKGIGWDKDFMGKEALLKVKEEGPKREMLGFTVEDDDYFIRSEHLGGPGEPVIFNGEKIGKVFKLVYGYATERNIGYIFVEKGKVKPGDKVYLHGHEAVVCEKYFI